VNKVLLEWDSFLFDGSVAKKIFNIRKISQQNRIRTAGKLHHYQDASKIKLKESII